MNNIDQIGIVSKMLKLLLIDPEADLLIPISSNKIKYRFYSHISNKKPNILELQEKVKNYKSIFLTDIFCSSVKRSLGNFMSYFESHDHNLGAT